MEKTNIFTYLSYKTFLEDVLKAESKKRAGGRARLAKATGCQGAYVSQVLGGPAHFSLEQGDRINRYLGHSKDEALFFLALIQFERAGTQSLKEIFRSQLREITERNLSLRNRLEYKKTLTEQDQAIYYSSWIYAAIHVLVSIPGLNTEHELAQHLNLPIGRIKEVLAFLASRGLLVETGDTYKQGATSVHLGSNSPFVRQHHMNLRHQAIRSLDFAKAADELHYSSFATLAREDAMRIRALLTESIEKVRSVIKNSKEEVGYCYAVDLFEI